MEAFTLMKELKANCEQEVYYLPKESGLNLIESTTEQGKGISAKCRDVTVEDLWSLTSFFGYNTETFVLAVNLLDRFLAIIKAQPKHLACIGVSCLHIAAAVVEERDVASSHELLRIGQCKFTVSDLSRMEKIVSEKLHFQFKAITALTFLRLYQAIALSHKSHRKNVLNLDKLEAQLKACLCRIVFSKAKPSVLALSLLTQEIESSQSPDLLEIARYIQAHLRVPEVELQRWRGLVGQCLAQYSSPQCSKPDHRKLMWVVSRRTAQNLHSSYCSVPDLPTIPEASWDESER